MLKLFNYLQINHMPSASTNNKTHSPSWPSLHNVIVECLFLAASCKLSDTGSQLNSQHQAGYSINKDVEELTQPLKSKEHKL